MSLTYAPLLLSGSTNGRNIPVAATATPGTLLHTAVAGGTAWDEIYLWAANTSGASVSLTVEYGGVTSPGDHLVDTYSIPANSAPIPIATGQRMNGGLNIRAYASAAGAINITGNVNRIS